MEFRYWMNVSPVQLAVMSPSVDHVLVVQLELVFLRRHYCNCKPNNIHLGERSFERNYIGGIAEMDKKILCIDCMHNWKFSAAFLQPIRLNKAFCIFLRSSKISFRLAQLAYSHATPLSHKSQPHCQPAIWSHSEARWARIAVGHGNCIHHRPFNH